MMTRLTVRTLALGLFMAFFVDRSPTHAQETLTCDWGRYDRVTDDFYFSTSSVEGAVGDVVAVDFFLTIEQAHDEVGSLSGFGGFACFDDEALEWLDAYEFPDEISSSAWLVTAERVEARFDDSGRTAVNFHALYFRGEADGLFPTGVTTHVLTAYFRVRAPAGAVSQFEFCDYSVRVAPNHEQCYRNVVGYKGPTSADQLTAFSTLHESGEIRVLPGPATQPDVPAFPPSVLVYEDAPTAETAAVAFEAIGGVALPGSTGVPMEIYASSAQEWSGASLSLAFPAAYLTLRDVRMHTPQRGAVRIDNEAGHLAALVTLGRRRLGAEGERVHLATLLFDVSEQASEVSEIAPRFEPDAQGLFFNWLEIHHGDGQLGTEPLGVTAHVEPLRVAAGAFAIQVERTVRGDIDLDYELTLTDAVGLLGELFLGESHIVCEPAADFDRDDQLTISDPIGILAHLYLGGPPAVLEPEILCVE